MQSKRTLIGLCIILLLVSFSFAQADYTQEEIAKEQEILSKLEKIREDSVKKLKETFAKEVVQAAPLKSDTPEVKKEKLKALEELEKKIPTENIPSDLVSEIEKWKGFIANARKAGATQAADDITPPAPDTPSQPVKGAPEQLAKNLFEQFKPEYSSGQLTKIEFLEKVDVLVDKANADSVRRLLREQINQFVINEANRLYTEKKKQIDDGKLTADTVEVATPNADIQIELRRLIGNRKGAIAPTKSSSQIANEIFDELGDEYIAGDITQQELLGEVEKRGLSADTIPVVKSELQNAMNAAVKEAGDKLYSDNEKKLRSEQITIRNAADLTRNREVQDRIVELYNTNIAGDIRSADNIALGIFEQNKESYLAGQMTRETFLGLVNLGGYGTTPLPEIESKLEILINKLVTEEANKIYLAHEAEFKEGKLTKESIDKFTPNTEIRQALYPKISAPSTPTTTPQAEQGTSSWSKIVFIIVLLLLFGGSGVFALKKYRGTTPGSEPPGTGPGSSGAGTSTGSGPTPPPTPIGPPVPPPPISADEPDFKFEFYDRSNNIVNMPFPKKDTESAKSDFFIRITSSHPFSPIRPDAVQEILVLELVQTPPESNEKIDRRGFRRTSSSPDPQIIVLSPHSLSWHIDLRRRHGAYPSGDCHLKLLYKFEIEKPLGSGRYEFHKGHKDDVIIIKEEPELSSPKTLMERLKMKWRRYRESAKISKGRLALLYQMLAKKVLAVEHEGVEIKGVIEAKHIALRKIYEGWKTDGLEQDPEIRKDVTHILREKNKEKLKKVLDGLDDIYELNLQISKHLKDEIQYDNDVMKLLKEIYAEELSEAADLQKIIEKNIKTGVKAGHYKVNDNARYADKISEELRSAAAKDFTEEQHITMEVFQLMQQLVGDVHQLQELIYKENLRRKVPQIESLTAIARNEKGHHLKGNEHEILTKIVSQIVLFETEQTKIYIHFSSLIPGLKELLSQFSALLKDFGKKVEEAKKEEENEKKEESIYAEIMERLNEDYPQGTVIDPHQRVLIWRTIAEVGLRSILNVEKKYVYDNIWEEYFEFIEKRILLVNGLGGERIGTYTITRLTTQPMVENLTLTCDLIPVNEKGEMVPPSERITCRVNDFEDIALLRYAKQHPINSETDDGRLAKSTFAQPVPAGKWREKSGKFDDADRVAEQRIEALVNKVMAE